MTYQQFICDPPGEMNLRAHTLAPTTITDLPSPVNTSPHNESNTKFSAFSRQSGVTVRDAPSFPYLAAMINKAAGHTQKKVVFDRSDYDDLLGQIIDQREAKKERESNDRQLSQVEEQRLLAFQREKMFEERYNELEDKSLK